MVLPASDKFKHPEQFQEKKPVRVKNSKKEAEDAYLKRQMEREKRLEEGIEYVLDKNAELYKRLA